MPSTSKSQQRLFGWALACKQGKSDNCPVNIKKLGDSMSVEELEKMAKTKHEDLPEKVKEALAEAYSAITPDQLGILLEGFAGMGTVPEGNLSPSGNPAPPPGIKAAEKGTGSGDVHDKSITPSLFKMPGEKQGKHERRVLSFDEFLKTINYKTHDDTLQKGHGQNLTESAINESGKGHMTINDFSSMMVSFYDEVNMNAEFLDDETKMYLKKAFALLDQAWEAEADAHGVDFEKYPVKL